MIRMTGLKLDNVFIGSRQCGKTTWLIRKMLEDSEMVAVVSNKHNREYMIKAGQRYEQFIICDGPYPITKDRIVLYDAFNKMDKSAKYFIDDLNLYIQKYPININEIGGYTMTLQEENNVF